MTLHEMHNSFSSFSLGQKGPLRHFVQEVEEGKTLGLFLGDPNLDKMTTLGSNGELNTTHIIL